MKRFIHLIILLTLLVSCETEESKNVLTKGNNIQTNQDKKSNAIYKRDYSKLSEHDTCQISISGEKSENKIDTVELNKKMILRATYQLTHTASLRQAIDLFNTNQTINKYISKFAFDGNENYLPKNIIFSSNDVKYSFVKLHKEGYLSGKFILINYSENKNGVIDLDVMFQHKQDKIFRFVMNYDKANNIFVIIAVYVPEKYDEQAIKFYRRLYSIYLNDDNFGV